MKIGILFYPTAYTIDLMTLGKAVEDAGFDSFWVPEHAAMPVDSTPHPLTGGPTPAVYGQKADPFVALSFIAAATTTLKIATGICSLPEHHPLLLAKTVGTLDNFSGGRFLFGVGVGWHRGEIELFGTDFDTRWTYARESIEAMKVLWRDGVGSYEGALVKFPPVMSDPMPAQRPHPPVIIGGLNTVHTHRRVAQWGDGWFAAVASPEELAAARRAIDAECDKVGRDPSTIELSVAVLDPSPSIRRAYDDAGADRLIVPLYNHPGEPLPYECWPEATVAAVLRDTPSPAETLHALDVIHRLAGL